MKVLHLSCCRASLFATGVLIAGCGGPNPHINAPGSTSSIPSSLEAAHTRLSGEKFASSRATSKCSGDPLTGTFRASGKARGPLPGTFTAHGNIVVSSSGAEIAYNERFKIQSNSTTISGSARIINGSSGSPVVGCSKNGKLSFDMPILQYRVKGSQQPGAGWSNFSGGVFTEAFQ